MANRLAKIGFFAATCFLPLWLFAHWYAWAMADFDCADGYWVCRKDLIEPFAFKIGVPILIWLVCLLMIFKTQKIGK